MNTFHAPLVVAFLKSYIRESFNVCCIVLGAVLGFRRTLVVEFNVCHQEVVVGFDYILKYSSVRHVVVVAREHFFENASYLRALGVSPYYLNYRTIKWFLTSCLNLVFRKVIVCSSFDYRIGQEIWSSWPPVLSQSRMIYVVHDPASLPSSSSAKMVSDATLIRLSRSRASCIPGMSLQLSLDPEAVSNILRSHDDVARIPIAFLVPGTTGLDIPMLRGAAEFMCLCCPGQFTITVTGHHSCSAHEVREMEDLGISMVGRVSGGELLAHIVASRFIIAPLDFRSYIKRGAVSASLQMSIGFLKPLIVAKELAADWAFPSDACICYGDTFSDGLVDAMNMDDSEYSRNLRRLRRYGALTDFRSSCVLSSLMS